MTGEASSAAYRPGSWVLVVGPRAAVLLERAPTDLATRLWPAVRDGADFSTLLEAVTGEGWTRAPHFALVHTEPGDDGASVVVRGEAVVDAVVDGVPSELTGARRMTWAEHRVDAVLSLRAPGDAVVGAGMLPVVSGVVLADELEWAAESPARLEAEDPSPVPEPVPVPVPAPAPDASDTLAPGVYDHLWEPSVGPRPAPGTNRSVDEVADDHDHDPDHDHDTVSAAVVAGLRGAAAPPSLPSSPGSVPSLVTVVPGAASRPVTGGWVLRFSDGQRVPVAGRVLIGRSPHVDRAPGHDVPRVVPVESPSGDISRNHLEVHDDGTRLVASDQHSTNGSLVTLPGASEEQLTGGGTAELREGAVVDLGDGVVITVERGAAP